MKLRWWFNPDYILLMCPTRRALRNWSTLSSSVPLFDSFFRSVSHLFYIKTKIISYQVFGDFGTFISLIDNLSVTETRIFFLTLMLEFSLTLMPWFSKTRPSFGTGPCAFSFSKTKTFPGNRFRLFTPFTALAIAPVEAHYSRDLVTWFWFIAKYLSL